MIGAAMGQISRDQETADKPRETTRATTQSVFSAFAILVAASRADAFESTMWPHHEAMARIAAGAKERGLAEVVRNWKFAVTSQGRSLVGLAEALWTLSAEGWLRED